MIQPILINSALVWERILEIEDAKRRDPYGDFAEGPQPFDHPTIMAHTVTSIKTEASGCQCCPQEQRQGTQPV